MTKVYKITLLVVDHDDCGPDDVKEVIENQRYPNHCIHPDVMAIETREIEWDDRHPLNITATTKAAFEELFK